MVFDRTFPARPRSNGHLFSDLPLIVRKLCLIGRSFRKVRRYKPQPYRQPEDGAEHQQERQDPWIARTQNLSVIPFCEVRPVTDRASDGSWQEEVMTRAALPADSEKFLQTPMRAGTKRQKHPSRS